ncbi:MAG: UrcA family protein [Steroidobacteraceae bacterium]
MNALNRITGLIVLASFTGLAFGATSDDPPQRVVNYADLSIDRKAGAETLLFRIKSAAREVCAPLLDPGVTAAMSHQRCLSQAIGRAVADVDAPALAQVYRETPVK